MSDAMTNTKVVWRPRRLLLDLLAAEDRRGLLDQAARLARALEADIAGYVVEDSALFDLAGLPFGTEIGAVSRRQRAVETDSLSAAMARSVAACRRDLARLADSLGHAVPLEVVRGRAADPLRRARREDLVVFAGAAQRLDDPELAAALVEAARRAAGLLLAPTRPAATVGPILAQLSSPAHGETLLPLLRRLAGDGEATIDLSVADPDALSLALASARRRRARLVVGEAGAVLVDGAGGQARLRLLLRRLPCPLLLVNLAPEAGTDQPSSA